jgi:hypothetical protein
MHFGTPLKAEDREKGRQVASGSALPLVVWQQLPIGGTVERNGDVLPEEGACLMMQFLASCVALRR